MNDGSVSLVTINNLNVLKKEAQEIQFLVEDFVTALHSTPLETVKQSNDLLPQARVLGFSAVKTVQAITDLINEVENGQ